MVTPVHRFAVSVVRPDDSMAAFDGPADPCRAPPDRSYARDQRHRMSASQLVGQMSQESSIGIVAVCSVHHIALTSLLLAICFSVRSPFSLEQKSKETG